MDENESRSKEMTQTHLADDPAVVYVLRVAHDPLQKGHQGETVCLRHADVYDSCETRGETGLRVVRKAIFERGKGLHTFEMRFSTIKSLALSISVTLRGRSALFYG
jgi:hypothetical protein